MKDAIYKIAEQKIQEAIEQGELENLPGRGKPLNLKEDSHVPEDVRAAYKVLKNAGVLPEEMDLHQTIKRLELMIAQATSVEEKENLKAKLSDKRLQYEILMEKRRKR